MADKKYYAIDEAAAALGISPAEVNLRRERNELHGYRDGVNWKFKAEDVDALARRLRTQAASLASDDDTGEVLLNEVALGGSDAGVSGTVIGGEADEKRAADSDLRLVDSEVKLGGSGPKLTDDPLMSGTVGPAPAAAKKAPPTSPVDDLDLSINEELLLDEETPFKPDIPASSPSKASGPAIASGATKLDDDDLVIGGSGSGSDITIGGDSGISLVDPTDSGLSLEEPLELERETPDDSLELGEDDMLTFSDDSAAIDPAEAATMMKPEEGFQLTPMEDALDDESESGSQVIALEGTPVSEVAPTMIAGSGAAPGGRGHARRGFCRRGCAGGTGPRNSGCRQSAGHDPADVRSGRDARGDGRHARIRGALHRAADHLSSHLCRSPPVLRVDELRPAPQYVELERHLHDQQQTDGPGRWAVRLAAFAGSTRRVPDAPRLPMPLAPGTLGSTRA